MMKKKKSVTARKTSRKEKTGNSKAEDIFNIQAELLELSIKSGRRLMHDYKHMIQEVPQSSPFKEEFRERGKMWEKIFYPENGMKDYRSRLHQTIMDLELELSRAKRLLAEHNIIDPDTPF